MNPRRIDQLRIDHLDRWLRRYRVQRAVRWSLRGAALALALALAITLIAVLRGLLLQSEFIADRDRLDADRS